MGAAFEARFAAHGDDDEARGEEGVSGVGGGGCRLRGGPAAGEGQVDEAGFELRFDADFAAAIAGAVCGVGEGSEGASEPGRVPRPVAVGSAAAVRRTRSPRAVRADSSAAGEVAGPREVVVRPRSSREASWKSSASRSSWSREAASMAASSASRTRVPPFAPWWARSRTMRALVRGVRISWAKAAAASRR